MKEIYRLNEYKHGDFYRLSNKIVLDQIIYQKDFSECSIHQVNFSNCIFTWTSFPCTKCEDLTFEQCILKNTHFTDSELENFIFNNCQLTDIEFSTSDSMGFDFINCKLKNVHFNIEDLTDFKFDNCQLQDVSFLGSLLDNITIKNSTLEKVKFASTKVDKRSYLVDPAFGLIIQNSILRNIDFNPMIILRTVSKNGISTTEKIQIKNYNHFLTEFVQNDFEVLRSIMVFFTLVISVLYTFLKPELFSFFWQSKFENYINIFI